MNGIEWDMNGIWMGYEWDMDGILMVYEWDMNGIPVVPHKAVAEVSKIGNYRRDLLL